MVSNNSQVLFGIARTLPHEYIRKYGSTKSIQAAKQAKWSSNKKCDSCGDVVQILLYFHGL